MQTKIIVAGNLVVDVIKMIDSYPKKEMLSTIREIGKSVGGCVANVGIYLQKLTGIEVSAYGKVGKDANGIFLIDALSSSGIDVSHINVTDEVATSFTDVMTEREGGRRTFFHFRGANALFGADDVEAASLDADLFHVGYAMLLDRLDAADAEYGTGMARLLCKVREKGIRTSLDVVSESSPGFPKVIGPSLPYCDYIIINETEAGLISGIDPCGEGGYAEPARIEQICRWFLERGVKGKVVVHCREFGASMAAADGAFCVVPSLELPKGYIKGTVGAGDAFCAGMLYSIVNGYGDEQALRVAAAVAASNLAFSDSVGGARPIGEIMTILQQYGRKHDQ